QVTPVIDWVADTQRQYFGEGEEFFVGRSISGDIALMDPMSTHGPPLIVIPLQPDLVQMGKLTIVGDILRGQMTVVIEDRLISGKPVIQLACCFTVQQKIVGDEAHGWSRIVRLN